MSSPRGGFRIARPAIKFAEEKRLLFLETSALDTTNVDKAFEWLVTEIFKAVNSGGQAPVVSSAGNKSAAPSGQTIRLEEAPLRGGSSCGACRPLADTAVLNSLKLTFSPSQRKVLAFPGLGLFSVPMFCLKIWAFFRLFSPQRTQSTACLCIKTVGATILLFFLGVLEFRGILPLTAETPSVHICCGGEEEAIWLLRWWHTASAKPLRNVFSLQSVRLP